MYKQYLLITNNGVFWYDTEEELENEMLGITEDIDVKFAGKINVEQVWSEDRKKLLFV